MSVKRLTDNSKWGAESILGTLFQPRQISCKSQTSRSMFNVRCIRNSALFFMFELGSLLSMNGKCLAESAALIPQVAKPDELKIFNLSCGIVLKPNINADIFELQKNIVIRLRDECRSGRREVVCQSFVISKDKHQCAGQIFLGKEIRQLNIPLSTLNATLPSSSQIPEVIIRNANLQFPYFTESETGSVLLFEGAEEFFSFKLEQ